MDWLCFGFLCCIFEILTSSLGFSSFLFDICCFFCISKNLIFSTHFFTGIWLLALLLSSLLTLSFLPHIISVSFSPLLYITLWISLGVPGCREHLGIWLLARLLSPLLAPPFLLLVTLLHSLSSLPYITPWILLHVPGCGELFHQ